LDVIESDVCFTNAKVCLGLKVQAGQLKKKIGSISNLGQQIDNFHAGVDMVIVLVIRLVGKRWILRFQAVLPRKWKIPTKVLSRKLGPGVWASLYGRNKPSYYLVVLTILTSTFFFLNFLKCWIIIYSIL
jgi:hypothetical protein